MKLYAIWNTENNAKGEWTRNEHADGQPIQAFTRKRDAIAYCLEVGWGGYETYAEMRKAGWCEVRRLS